MATTTEELTKRISDELDATLKLIDDTQRRSIRAVIPGGVWLRAARGCWLIGDLDWASDLYRRSANSILIDAQQDGRRQGIYAPIAMHVMGSAWMANDRELLDQVGGTIDESCKTLIQNVDLTPEPLFNATLHLTRIRVAWFTGRGDVLTKTMPDLDRAVRALDRWGQWYWEGERDIHTHSVVKALLERKADAVKAGLVKYDEYLTEQRGASPTVSELVDEEFISLASTAQDLGIVLPKFDTILLPVR